MGVTPMPLKPPSPLASAGRNRQSMQPMARVSHSSDDAPTRGARSWTRRDWLGATLGGGLALGLGGCDKISLHRKPKITGTIRILIWEDYFSPQLLEHFTERTGVAVEPKYFGSNDQLPKMLEAESFDLAMPSSFMAKNLKEREKPLVIKREKTTNLPLDGSDFTPQFDPENDFFVPYIWGATGIGYNADLVSGLPKSWSALFGPVEPPPDVANADAATEKNATKAVPLPSSLAPKDARQPQITVLDDARFALGSALIAMGRSPATNNRAEIEKAGQLLIRLIQRGAKFESNLVPEKLSANQIDLGMAWSGDVARVMLGDQWLREEEPSAGETGKRWIIANKKARLSLPQEGAIIFTDGFVIPASTTNRASAEAFLSYLFEPQIAAAVTNYSCYATTVKDSRTFVHRTILNGPSYFKHPSGAKKNYLLDGSAAESEYEEVWQKVKDAPTTLATSAEVTLPKS